MKSNREKGSISSRTPDQSHLESAKRGYVSISLPLVSILVIVILTLIHLWIRWPAFHLSYFHNEDTAGITYSADLILRGGLPLIDTVEMKAPAAAAAPLGL